MDLMARRDFCFCTGRGVGCWDLKVRAREREENEGGGNGIKIIWKGMVNWRFDFLNVCLGGKKKENDTDQKSWLIEKAVKEFKIYIYIFSCKTHHGWIRECSLSGNELSVFAQSAVYLNDLHYLFIYYYLFSVHPSIYLLIYRQWIRDVTQHLI